MTTTCNAIRSVLAWNTHRLGAAKFLAVSSRICQLKPDVAVLTETELVKGDVPTVPEYSTLLPRVHDSRLVRTLMLVRRNLHPEPLDTPTDLPVVAARVGKSAILGVYRQWALVGTERKGETFEKQQLDQLEELVRSISARFTTVYITGDLNFDTARHDDPTYYKQALQSRWLAFLEELGFTYHATGPTFTSDGAFNGIHRTAVLDHMYTRTRSTVNVHVLTDTLSDHKPILAKLGRAQPKKPVRETRCDRNWKAMDKQLLEMSLLTRDWNKLLSTTDLNEAVTLLEGAVAAAVEVSVPTRSYTTPNLSVRLKPDTRACMRARDKAKSQGKECFKRLRNKTLSLVRRDHIHHNLERIKKGGPAAAWQIVKEHTGKEKGHELPLPASCKTNSEAANAANDHYVDKVLKLRQSLNAQPVPDANVPDANAPEAYSKNGFKFHCIGTQAVKRALFKLPNKTSVGVDKIPVTVFKTGWSAIALPLVHIVNLVIKSGEWPSRWKRALITPVLKSGKPPKEVASYRPVALLCSVAKIVERVLYDQLVDFIQETQGILPREQHGFRPGFSTNTALAIMMAKVASALDRGLKVGLSCFDFSSAFDTIEASALDRKMDWASNQARALIKDYLSGGQQVVIWNGSPSNMHHIRYGVRQGSILGPLLYIILTGDLPKIMTSNVDLAAQAAALLYADDTTGITQSKTWECTDKAMSEIAANLEGYAQENGLYLNKAKTQTLRINHKDTPPTSTLNILGVQVNRSGGFSSHHTTMLSDLRGRLGAVRRLATAMGRGKLLSEIGQSLVIGKIQCNAFVTRELRLDPKSATGEDTATQRIINDLARTLIGARRADRLRVSDLADRSGLPTLNQIVAKQAAMNAWKSQNGGPLNDILVPYDDRTRKCAESWRKPTSTRCVAASNMAKAWNASPLLREAKSLTEAKSAAKKLAEEARHL